MITGEEAGVCVREEGGQLGKSDGIWNEDQDKEWKINTIKEIISMTLFRPHPCTFLIQTVYWDGSSFILLVLPSEGTSFCKPCFSCCGWQSLADCARVLVSTWLTMVVILTAFWAFHIHEVRTVALYQVLLFIYSLLKRDEGASL